MKEESNGWFRYEKLVISELERLNESNELLYKEILNFNVILHEIKNKNSQFEIKIEKLEDWQREIIGNLGDVEKISKLLDEIDSLKKFKIRVYTVLIVMNVIWGLGVTIFKLFLN